MPMSTKSSCRCPQSRYDAGKCSRAFVPSKRVPRGDSSDILIPAQHVYSPAARFRNSDDRKSRNAGFLEYPRTCIPACFPPGERFRILSTSTFALPLIATAGGRCPQSRYADVHKVIMPMSTKSSCRCPQSHHGNSSPQFRPNIHI